MEQDVLPPRWKSVTVFSIMLGVFSILYLVSFYLLYRVYKAYRFSDKPMFFSIMCVHCALGILVLYNSIQIDNSILRDKSIFESTRMILALSTTLLGFILEFVILSGLIFDLYKWWLFITMTNDEKNEDLSFNERIDDITKSDEYENSTKKQSAVEAQKLQFKIKVYYSFILIGIVMALSTMALTIGFIVTVIPQDLKEGSNEYNEAKDINDRWVKAFTSFVNFSYLAFLLLYLFTLSLLKIRLKRYFPDFYASQRIHILRSAFCLLFSIGIKILMRSQKLWIPNYAEDLQDSKKNDTWFYPLIILFGQIGEYPFILGSILLSLKSTLNPGQQQKVFIEHYETENSSKELDESIRQESISSRLFTK